MKSLKWLGFVLACFFGILIIAILVLYALGQARLKRVYDVSVRQVPIPENIESLAEGKRIFQYRGCEACHGEDLGGKVYLDNPALGQVITPNLTTGSGGLGVRHLGLGF